MLKIIKIPMVWLGWGFLWFLLSWLFIRYNWNFDYAKISDWQRLDRLWEEGKFAVNDSDSLFFVLSVLSVIPVWLVSCVILMSIDITRSLRILMMSPIYAYKRARMRATAKKPMTSIKKKKSYVQIRPPALKPMAQSAHISPRQGMEDVDNRDEDDDDFADDDIMSGDALPPPSRQDGSRREDKYGVPPRDYDHDDDHVHEDKTEEKGLEFLDDAFENRNSRQGFMPPSPAAGGIGAPPDYTSLSARASSASYQGDMADVPSVIEQAGYRVIKDVSIEGKDITVAVSNNVVVLCFEENQAGDWLADEERFNDDAPLWFSESAQKVSPVSVALGIKAKVEDALSPDLPNMLVVPVLVISKGIIINASDMLSVWEELQVFVGRIGSGGPNDLKPLSKLIPKNPDSNVDEDNVHKVEDILKSIK